MNQHVKRALARGLVVGLSLAVGGLAIGACDSIDDNSTIVPIASSGTVPQVDVGPTLPPPDLSDTTPKDEPNFAPIDAPEPLPDLPAPPTAGNPEADGIFGSQGFIIDQSGFGGYVLRFNQLQVRGTIASVTIQALNITCNSDITNLLSRTARDQFVATLLGRGNSQEDANGFDFEFTIPYNADGITATEDGRILIKATRAFPTADGGSEDFLSGDDIVIIVTITDAFGQQERFESNIFDVDSEEDEPRALTTCGALVSNPLVFATPDPAATPTPEATPAP